MTDEEKGNPSAWIEILHSKYGTLSHLLRTYQFWLATMQAGPGADGRYDLPLRSADNVEIGFNLNTLPAEAALVVIKAQVANAGTAFHDEWIKVRDLASEVVSLIQDAQKVAAPQ